MKKIIVFLTGILLFPFGISSQQQTPLQQFVSNSNLISAGISVLVREIEGGKEVVEYQSKTDRMPASLMKLLTTATALELLTDTFRFQTRIEYDGFILEDSVLNGHIYVTGGGDPTLESSYRKTLGNFYAQSMGVIRNAGINRISGRVIGDASLFEESGSPFHWLVEDAGSYYSPTPSALSTHDNLFYLTLQAGVDSVRLAKVQPYTRLFSPEMNFKIGGKEMSWRVSKPDFSWRPVIRGTLPAGKQVTIRTEMPEPALFVADSLANLLRLSGIAVDSACTTVRACGSSRQDRKLLYVYSSEPLKSIVRETNHRSINLYAENIFNYLALQKDSVAAATMQSAALAISRYWKEKGLPVRNVFQADGSGLSMKNAVNADFFVQLLVYMKKKGKYGDSFVASLPTAGVNGTVASFLAGTPLSGKVYAKSGSMERVQNYSGYIVHKNKWYAFCVIVNNFEGDRAVVKKQISTFLNAIFTE
jgi:D-alanyl-D-alanine carboxypeptidase/D-alanyl-D-alanine-endopeptidase (penicillin-binding protein 4)